MAKSCKSTRANAACADGWFRSRSLTPRLSSLWLGLVTPIYARIGRKLIDSMRNPTLVRDPSALTIFSVKPKGLREAIERALHHEDQEFAKTRWSDALSSSGKSPSWGGVRVGTRLIDSRSVQVSVSPTLAFAPILRIGGSNGWYFANFLWWCRGFVDLACGRRGPAPGPSRFLTHWPWEMHLISGEWIPSSRIVN